MTEYAGLRVAVLVPALTDQAVRLLAGLREEGFAGVRVFAAPEASAEDIQPMARLVLAVERRMVPSPRRNPLPDLPSPTIEAMNRPAGFDLVIDLGGGVVDAGLAASARYGVWRIATAPLTEALAGLPATETILLRHGPADGPRIVARALYDSKPLASHNEAYVHEKSAQMILREVKRCAFLGQPADLGPLPQPAPKPRPGAWRYLRATALEAWARLGHAIDRRRGRFSKGFGLRLGRGTALGFDPGATWPVPMPQVALWADPFLIAHAGHVYCFFEDVDPALGRGHISVGRVTETGLADVQTALRLRHHMSYPFVFHHQGALLMMPEVHAAGRLEIWRCTAFPGEWQLYASALEGVAVADSVLLERDGVWWLFTHISRDRFGDFCSDLHVFRVNGPDLSGLVPHRLNPVVTDAATARGGGRILQEDGRLLRFSQDNAQGSYGGALNMMEIVRLDLDHYEERRLRHITPDFAPGLLGCHHFDAAEGWVVIDAR